MEKVPIFVDHVEH
jgi:hypothetical protein